MMKQLYRMNIVQIHSEEKYKIPLKIMKSKSILKILN